MHTEYNFLFLVCKIVLTLILFYPNLHFWTVFRSEWAVSTIFPLYIMTNGTNNLQYPPFKEEKMTVRGDDGTLLVFMLGVTPSTSACSQDAISHKKIYVYALMLKIYGQKKVVSISIMISIIYQLILLALIIGRS